MNEGVGGVDEICPNMEFIRLPIIRDTGVNDMVSLKDPDQLHLLCLRLAFLQTCFSAD